MRRGFVGLPVILIVLILGISLGAFYYFYYYQKQPGVKSPASVSTPDQKRTEGVKPFVGFMGTVPEDFPLVNSWGANMAHWHSASGADLNETVTAAKEQNLNLMVSAFGRSQLQNPKDSTLDLAKAEDSVRTFFSDNPKATDPSVVAVWIIDEPCHQGRPGGPPKWVLTARDLNDLYQIIKKVDPNIPIFINFGYLECLERFVNEAEPGWKLADLAGFTITEKKARSGGTFIAEEAARAKAAKAFDPQMAVVPQVAVFEPIGRGAPLPSAEWVRTTGLEVVKYDSFDGILYYSFNDVSDWMGQTISDVKDDPAYVSAFKEVLSQANY